MKGIGLVFAGGGGKGSYEIGVWKYLHEIGIDQYVNVVSGTSVGALNAALFSGSNYETAERIWLNISKDKILTPREVTEEDIALWIQKVGLGMMFPYAMNVGKVMSGVLVGVDSVAQTLVSKIKRQHFFSRKGLVDIISEGVNFNYLNTAGIPCYATCLNCESKKTEEFQLNDYSEEEIITLLLASSAIPVIFPTEKFNGKEYCDGGTPVVGDNVPIKPAYATGVENIIVVHLDQTAIIDKEQYPNANIIEIVPREDLGDVLKGTLDFSPEGASYRLNLGYEDAKRIMQPMVDMLVMRKANQQMLVMAQRKNVEFERNRAKLIKASEEIKNKMANDGFNDVYAELMEEE